VNAEKLHQTINLVNEDVNRTKIVTHLQSIVSMLNNLANSPNQSHQQTLASSLTSFLDGINKSNFDQLSASTRKIMTDICPNLVLGSTLGEKVRSIIEKNQITFQVAVNEINPLFNEINQFIANSKALLASFQVFNISKEVLETGECEIGFIVPREEIKNDFHVYQKELQEFEFIINNYNEYVSGKKQKIELKAISSTDPMIYIGVITAVGASIAKTIDWIIDSYKKILEIRLLREQLKNAGVPEDKTKGIEDYANELMSKKIDEMLEILRKEYCGIKNGDRKNELENGLRISMNKIANRIDSGFNYEVRVGALPKTEADETDDNEEQKNYDEIKRVESKLIFTNMLGSKILSLPEKEVKK